MRHYHHLILSEREKLLFFLAKGYTLTYIANKLGRNKSTISRKLHRNAFGKHYLSVDAEAKARPRHFHCHPHKKWDAPVFHYSCSSKVIISNMISVSINTTIVRRLNTLHHLL